jgi:hypothetical protein
MDGITPTYAPSPFQPTAALIKALLMHGARQLQHQEDATFYWSTDSDFQIEDRFPNFGMSQ